MPQSPCPNPDYNVVSPFCVINPTLFSGSIKYLLSEMRRTKIDLWVKSTIRPSEWSEL